MTRPMDNYEYIADRARRCPVCHSTAIRAADQMHIDSTLGLQPMACADCEVTWTETWQLTGYTLDEEVG